jgi:uncharacterized membrane protein YeaQ/YmgE (transglycosylase-associated protein family)
VVVRILAGWIAERINGPNHHLLIILIGAYIAGFLVSSVLGFRYVEGYSVASIIVATPGAVILLAILGGFQSRRTS